ncbi:MAG: BrnA antitoxin family protein [Actinobacteria bacterium]|nr:BrnA antitoxin family protein [Actinomycetota bacterium]MCL5674555.1 BrnA antitoxin family protein [Candidatus Omnitrophota bacterium]
MKKLKKIPRFKNEDAEREFWAVHDSTEYIDWSKAKKARFSYLKPSEKAISIRMPKFIIDDLKFLANRQSVPYQSLLKIFVTEKVKKELAGLKIKDS